MKNKILWLSILGLALARPPNPIDSTASNSSLQQKQRSSRSIWPFSSSETTTEAPVNYPPVLPSNNEWFVQGETPLPQGIDLKKYPVWKVHKYNGIDLHPVKLQPENTYPPEIHHDVDPHYSSGSSSSSDFPQNGYQSGYHDFGTHPTGHSAPYPSPSATYPAERETYQTGEFHGSSFTPGSSPFNIQTQQKYEVYAPPQPLTDFRSTAGPVVPEHPKIPLTGYGLSNTYRTGSMGSYQGHRHEEQKVTFGVGEEKSQSTDENNPDLSFLDDLGGLAPFLPEPTANREAAQLEETEEQQEEETEAPEEGFLERLFSRFRGSTEAPVPDVVLAETETETEKPANSGGFLSSIFALNSNAQSPEVESAVTQSSGGGFSSLFYQSETEKPAVIQPTTYYLPKTRGSYIAIKVPTNAASSFPPSVGPYDDVSNIAFHEVPKVPFTQHEIPHISSPTLDSGYPYNLGYSEVRNSGFSGSAISSDHQPSLGYHQPHPSTSKIAPHYTQNYGSHQQSDFGVENFSSNQGVALDGPHAEYLHSANNDQQNGVSTASSQSSSAANYYQGQKNSQDLRNSGLHQVPSTAVTPILGDHLPRSYATTMTPYIADELNQNQNEKESQNLSSQQHQFQSFDTTNSDFQGISNTQETFDHNIEAFSLGQTVNENEPISAPQISGGFVPSLAYGSTIKASDQVNFNTNNQEYSQQKTSSSENIAQDHSLGNIGDTLTQNFDSSSILSQDLVPPKESEPNESSVPVYHTSISTLQVPSNAPEPTDVGFLPTKTAYDFRETSSDQNDGDTRFIKNLAGLTAYGLPTNSYNSNSFEAASSNMRNFAVPAPTKDEVNDGVNINMNKDVSRSTLPEQLPTKKVDRVVRKVMKRKNLVESNLWRRSTPERQAPTEETDTSLVIRSEKDSIPEVRGSRQFDGAEVIDGYSKVQHQVLADTARITKPLTSVLETVQQ